MNERLRKQIRLLKAQGIDYKEIAQLLQVPNSTIYNWIKGYFNFGLQKQKRLYEIVSDLKE